MNTLAIRKVGLAILLTTAAIWLAGRTPPGGFALWLFVGCTPLVVAFPRTSAANPPRRDNPAPSVAPPLDAQERTDLEEQLRHAVKMEAVGRLAGGVAHDLNNLLTVINGYSDMLGPVLPAGDPSREMVQEIRNAGERAAGLTRQLLAFSRKQVLKPRLVDLNTLVQDLSKMLRRLIGEDIHLEFAGHVAQLPVLVDPGQMEQVLMNLAVNARDAMPRGGRLTLRTTVADFGDLPVNADSVLPPGVYARLTVADTGSGMDPATQARIFEPFFTTKDVGKGTGLGLSTVYGIIRQSRGLIAVESVPGRGTEFRIFLPLASIPRSTDAAPVTPPAPARGSETILLVEDEDGVRTVAQRALESCGYRVLTARDGLDALARFRGHIGPIDLVITDVVMPFLNGPELVERLKRLRPNLTTIFVSGYTDSVLVREGVADGAVTYLDKPFTAESLTGLVREVLDGCAVLVG